VTEIILPPPPSYPRLDPDMLLPIPSLRLSSAMLVSPRNPSRTTRILPSAEYCRRVARRMSRTVFSALSVLTARAPSLPPSA